MLVERDRIMEVSDRPVSTDTADRTIDLAGRPLMPDLIDAHVHVKATHLDISDIGLLAGRGARMPAIMKDGRFFKDSL